MNIFDKFYNLRVRGRKILNNLNIVDLDVNYYISNDKGKIMVFPFLSPFAEYLFKHKAQTTTKEGS